MSIVLAINYKRLIGDGLIACGLLATISFAAVPVDEIAVTIYKCSRSKGRFSIASLVESIQLVHDLWTSSLVLLLSDDAASSNTLGIAS